jgi:hypothetical protein
MEIKHCNKCGKDKPISEFGKNKSKKDGLQTMCKECVRAYGKLHYATHKEDYINRNRSYREHNREWLNSIKSQLKCSICGEDRIWCLDFHHTNPSEKEGSVSHMIQAPNKLKSELEKCIVLCANCHRDVHYQMNKDLQI